MSNSAEPAEVARAIGRGPEEFKNWWISHCAHCGRARLDHFVSEEFVEGGIYTYAGPKFITKCEVATFLLPWLHEHGCEIRSTSHATTVFHRRVMIGSWNSWTEALYHSVLAVKSREDRDAVGITTTDVGVVEQEKEND